MDDIEKARKLLNREPTAKDEPFDSLLGWEEKESTKAEKEPKGKK